jgi:3-deoxy-D-manno-octulosonate 8-phosphate phosphatase (KDO 8-P phosphatase)
MIKKNRNNFKIMVKDICLIVYDFDGVMTDNSVILSEDGKESVIVNRSDGLAVSILKDMGINQLILSKEKNSVVSERARKLGIPVLKGVDDKVLMLQYYCQENRLSLDKVVFIGNDINDIALMRVIGYPLCPKDAYPEVKKEAKFIIPVNGGRGVIRELLNNIKGAVDPIDGR